ncbi:ATP-binding cassette domain-containing protein [Flavobacterium suzhouense]|uniref:ATP-binding cassette domain-containing protein n=1 Tax=Flavobacterium suzhouense TaxID=1529638 RepID=A0ABW5NY10_9FLAO
MHTLTISELAKNFKSKSVLDYIAFECKTGDIIGILGRNGTGKSTLLKILFGTLKADKIRVSIDGKNISPEEIIPQQKIAYLPQESFLPKSLKVRDIAPLYFKEGDKQDKILYDPLIARMANTKAGNLSMGELRYFELMLISTLPHPFLMLDEPLSMVEPLYREKIKEKLLSLKTTKGIIMTDHYYDDILETANNCLLLRNGRLITVNSIDDLIGNGYLPASNY